MANSIPMVRDGIVHYDLLGIRLEALCRLPIGWDGYQAPPVTQAAACRARELLGVIAVGETVPQLVPACDGGIQIEWHHALVSIELYIPPVGHPLGAWSDDEIDAAKAIAGRSGEVITWSKETAHD